MRIFLLRLLIGWWIVPFAWLLMFPIGYLITGDYYETVEDTKWFCNYIWNGLEI